MGRMHRLIASLFFAAYTSVSMPLAMVPPIIELRPVIVTAKDPPVTEDTADDCCDPITQPVVHKGETVMLLGDSLALGMSREFRKIAQDTGYRPVTHAKVGSTASQWIKWVDQDLKDNNPSLVVVSLGTNDARGYADVKKNPGVFEALIDAIVDSGAYVVWIGPPAVDLKKVPRIKETRQLIKDVAPIYFESEVIPLHTEDGIHPNALGYVRWMRAVWDCMAHKMIVESRE